MSVSVLDLIAERTVPDIDGMLPAVGGTALWSMVEAMLEGEFGEPFPGRGGEYVGRLLRALDTPLPRIWVTAWRKYEELLELAPGDDHAGSSGTVPLKDETVSAHWELAPRVQGEGIAGPRLLVDLQLRFKAAEVVVETGRIVGVTAGSVDYEGSVAVKGAPEALVTVGPKSLDIDELELDFGDGYPIRPDFAG